MVSGASCYVSCPLLTMIFSLFFKARLVSMIRWPHVRHSSPISAPKRITRHSNPPQGCGLRRRTTSSKPSSCSTLGLYHPGFLHHERPQKLLFSFAVVNITIYLFDTFPLFWHLPGETNITMWLLMFVLAVPLIVGVLCKNPDKRLVATQLYDT